jgi:hypothetical protein
MKQLCPILTGYLENVKDEPCDIFVSFVRLLALLQPTSDFDM